MLSVKEINITSNEISTDRRKRHMNKNVDSAKKIDISKILGKYGVYIALLVLFVVMSFASNSFLTVTNLFNILRRPQIWLVQL